MLVYFLLDFLLKHFPFQGCRYIVFINATLYPCFLSQHYNRSIVSFLHSPVKGKLYNSCAQQPTGGRSLIHPYLRLASWSLRKPRPYSPSVLSARVLAPCAGSRAVQSPGCGILLWPSVWGQSKQVLNVARTEGQVRVLVLHGQLVWTHLGYRSD